MGVQVRIQYLEYAKWNKIRHTSQRMELGKEYEQFICYVRINELIKVKCLYVHTK